MSDTPRTDAEWTDDYYCSGYVPTEFAQQLERELSEAKEQLRLCNVDQFTTAAELAEATVKESLTPQRPWVGLTDEEIDEIGRVVIGFNSLSGWENEFGLAIEAKLREKNT